MSRSRDPRPTGHAGRRRRRRDRARDLGTFGRAWSYDSQLRWLGPEKGVMHMAIGAVVNAAWDLAAKRAGHRCGSCWPTLTPEDRRPGRLPLPHRRAHRERGAGDPARAPNRAGPSASASAASRRIPGLHDLPGWLGYSDEKLARLAGEAVADGFSRSSSRSARDVDDDVRRLRLAREAVGPDIRIAVDANQRWDVGDGDRVDRRAGRVRPVLDRGADRRPTTSSATPRSAGRVAPIRVATGEHVQNRVVFKQLLQAEAIDVVQIDAVPGRRRQREHRDPAAGRQVRRAGLPARRRRRPVRDGAAPGDVRLRGGLAARRRTGSSSTSTICTSTSSTRYECGGGTTQHRQPRDSALRCIRSRWRGTPIPTGRSGRPAVPNEYGQNRTHGFIDAHHHVWDLTRRPQPWLDERGLEPLRRSFSTADLVADAAAGLCDRTLAATVLVQCLPLVAETEELLRLAEQEQLVAGVVGWVDLTDPGVGNQLDRLRGLPGGQSLVGIRHLVQAESDPRWLLRADVRRGLDEVAERGLCYDLLVLPHQLPAAAALAEQGTSAATGA